MINYNRRTNPTLKHVVDQIERVFPERKMEAPTPTCAQFNHQRATVFFRVLINSITSLKPRVSARLGGLKNEYLLEFLFNKTSNANPRSKTTCGHLHSLTNKIASGILA